MDWLLLLLASVQARVLASVALAGGLLVDWSRGGRLIGSVGRDLSWLRVGLLLDELLSVLIIGLAGSLALLVALLGLLWLLLWAGSLAVLLALLLSWLLELDRLGAGRLASVGAGRLALGDWLEVWAIRG